MDMAVFMMEWYNHGDTAVNGIIISLANVTDQPQSAQVLYDSMEAARHTLAASADLGNSPGRTDPCDEAQMVSRGERRARKAEPAVSLRLIILIPNVSHQTGARQCHRTASLGRDRL